MNKIVRIHEKMLDHLLQLRQANSSLYFVPRKINNKNRLENGYWFIGNEEYLMASFWHGTDSKEKVHNINFVVLNNNSSAISLSAQDSLEKAIFLEKVAKKIGGFKRSNSKNIWHKQYSGTDYLKNLDSFIRNVKPTIDDLIEKEHPEGIYLLNRKFFDHYGKRVVDLREKQIKFGAKNKVSRICWNTEKWKRPSGSQGKSTASESYEQIYGYGHEEWLFDKSKVVDGYHYAFLEPLRLISDKHTNESYNVSFFTINNLNKKYFVGEIRNVECITKEESRRVYEIYRKKSWIDNMKTDVERVGADWETFIAIKPETFLNIKFKFKDVHRPDELVEISEMDTNITTNRFKLLPQKSDVLLVVESDDDEDEGNRKNTKTRKRVFNSECEYDPYHDQMQNAIFDLLKHSKKYNYKKVAMEKGRVDIKAKTQEGIWHYFELKTDNPKLSIRQALGQIMEYAYYPGSERAKKLIIVADEEPDENTMEYLDYIRGKFDLPVTYRHFNLETHELSEDY
ncbi:MAG: hypothetical protein JWO06_1984 [Bacteroidota bacterium]|nr:hypothetical protein [Bacteroidota bacterium]